MRKKTLEIIVCLALIGLGIAAYLTIGLAEGSASKFLLRQERGMGSLDYQSLPKIYSLALIAFCAANVLLLQIKRRRAESPQENAAPSDPRKRRLTVFRTAGTVLLLLAYVFAMQFTPFFAVTAVFLFLLFNLYGKTNPKISLPLSLAGALFFWVVFIKIANLPIGSG